MKVVIRLLICLSATCYLPLLVAFYVSVFTFYIMLAFHNFLFLLSQLSLHLYGLTLVIYYHLVKF